MKKILIIFLFLNLVALSSVSKEVWTKIGDNIYVNHKTIKKQLGAKIGWFKIVQPQNSTYKLEKYKVYCKSGIIEVKHTKIYNDDNTILEEEINDKNIGCDYQGVVNGEIYYQTLCKRKKF